MALHCSANEQWLRAVFLPSDAQGEGRGLRREGATRGAQRGQRLSHGVTSAHRPQSERADTRFLLQKNKRLLCIEVHKM